MRRNLRTWVRNLKGKKYTQGKNRLCTLLEGGEKKFCCLGVAADITPGITKASSASGRKMWYGESQNATTLPYETMEWLGLATSEPAVKIPTGDWVGLITLNDELGYSFQQIAELIEQQDADWDGTRRETK